MSRDPPRRDNQSQTTRFRDDRADRYSRKDDDDYCGSSRRDSEREYGRGGGGPPSSRRNGEERPGDRDRNRDVRGERNGNGNRYRDGNRDRDRDGDGSYGRGRDRRDDRRRDGVDDLRRDRDRDDRRAGPSRRSASPRPRSSKPESRSRSRSRSEAAEDKAKPNFGNSGLLAAATKTVQHGDGTKTVLKYHEPPEARKPTVGWRLYVFKGKEQVGMSFHVWLSSTPCS